MNHEDVSEQQRNYENEIRRRSLSASVGRKHLLVDLTILRLDDENVIADAERVLASGDASAFEAARAEIEFRQGRLAGLTQIEAFAGRMPGALFEQGPMLDVRCTEPGCGNLGAYTDGKCGHHTVSLAPGAPA